MGKFTKKITVKKPVKKTKKKVTEQKKYKLTAIINGETFNRKTDDLAITIMKLKPEILYCESYFTVTQGEDVAERKLNLLQGRKLFNDEFFLNVFINNLLLK